MIADFQKTFKPTEQDVEESVISYLNILIKLVKNKDCCTCKHSETRKAYMHSYETTETYCTLKQCVAMQTCNKYEVCNVQNLFT